MLHLFSCQIPFKLLLLLFFTSSCYCCCLFLLHFSAMILEFCVRVPPTFRKQSKNRKKRFFYNFFLLIFLFFLKQKKNFHCASSIVLSAKFNMNFMLRSRNISIFNFQYFFSVFVSVLVCSATRGRHLPLLWLRP